ACSISAFNCSAAGIAPQRWTKSLCISRIRSAEITIAARSALPDPDADGARNACTPKSAAPMITKCRLGLRRQRHVIAILLVAIRSRRRVPDRRGPGALLHGLRHDAVAALSVLELLVVVGQRTHAATALGVGAAAAPVEPVVFAAAGPHGLAAIDAARVAVELTPAATRVPEDAFVLERVLRGIERRVRPHGTEILHAAALRGAGVQVDHVLRPILVGVAGDVVHRFARLAAGVPP